MKHPLAYQNQLEDCPPRKTCWATTFSLLSLFLVGGVSLPSQAQSNSCVNPPVGLVSWWRGEGNVLDALSHAPGALVGGSDFGAGKVGQAFNVNGDAGSLVQIPDVAELNLTNTLTFEAWINVTVHSANDAVLVVGKDAPFGARQYMIGLVNLGSKWVFRAHLGLSSGFMVMDGSAAIATGVWYHVALTYDGGQFRSFVNGAPEASMNASGEIVTSTAPLWIGGFGTGPWNFNGRVDEVSLYNRALSPDEIQAIVTAAGGGKCAITNPPVPTCAVAPAGLISWWRAEQNATDALGNHSGDSLNGVRYTNGPVGTAFYFDGVDDRVLVPDAAALNFGAGADFSIEAWVKPEIATTAFGVQTIVNKRYSPNFLAAVGWEFGLIDGKLACQLADAPLTSGDYSTFLSTSPDLRDGNYHHVALSIQRGSATGGKLLVDGQVVLTFDPTIQPGDLSSTEPLRIGAHADTNLDGHFTGAVDEVSLYNRALTVAELQQIFSAANAGKCLATNPPGPTCVPAPADLVSWWQGENSPSDARGGNLGILRNTAGFSAGVVGQAFNFSGANDCVEIPYSASLITSNYTIETWVKPATQVSDGINQDLIFGQAYGHCQMVARPGMTGLRIAWQFGASPYYFPEVQSTTEIPIGAFSHLAGTWDGLTLRLYVNGVLSAETTPGASPVDSGCAFFIGGFYNPNADSCGYVGQFFNGVIDEVSFYSRALGANEIASVFHAGSAAKCAPTNNPPPPPAAAIPTIASFSPTVAAVGASVNIYGTNFSPVASNNIIYFGAVRAGVTAASANALTVTVPSGATHAPITVTVNGLTAVAPLSFLPSFVGSGSSISPNSFAPGQNLTVADGPLRTIIADLDGDGKPDLVEANAYAHNISLFRNIGVVGTLTGSSFAPRVDFPTLGGTDSPRCLTVADVDGDGRLDILIGDQATSSVLVYRNIAAPGLLTLESFATPVSFAAGSYPHGLRVADLNGDGLPEILVANQSGNSISILKNIGTAGSLTTNSFAAQSALATGPNPTDVAVADFNGDGRPDLVTTAFGGTQISVFRNVAAPGIAVSNWLTLDTTLPALPGGLEFAVADLDGDFKSDLILASVHGNAVSVYRNLADAGAFDSSSFAARVDFGTPGWAHNVVVGDFNGDAKPDLAVTGELGSYLAVFQNQSTPGSFTSSSLAARVDYPSGWNAWGVAAGDLDGDNRADIVFANTYDDTLTFYRNIVPFGESTNPPISCVNPPAGLVSWWKAENDAADLVNGNSGTLQNGVSFVPGEVGQGFTFDGANSYVEVPDAPSLRLTNELTIEFWVKRQLPFGPDYIVNKGGDWTGGVLNYGVAIAPPEYGNILHFTFAGGNRGTVAIADLNWHHCVVVARHGDSDVKFYVDGVFQSTTHFEGAGLVNLYPSTQPLRIGAQIDPPIANYFSKTLIDELSIYNRALSSNEIAGVFLAGSAGKCAPTNSEPPQVVAAPAITSFNPTVAAVSASVNIFGTNFSSVASSNIVYFGAVRAVVTAASSNLLTVTVPIGATHAPITVTVAGLTAAARTDFTPTYAGGAAISAASFSPRVNLGSGDGPTSTAIADFDGDGKPDLAVTDDYGHTLSVYRNISVAGTLDAGSFAPRVVLPASPANYSPYMLVTGDVDGDGKLDLITTDIGGNTVSVYRNQSAPGGLSSNSFAPFVSFSTGAGPRSVALVDLDADGRPEIVTANYDGSNVSVLRNTGVAGQISSDSFAPRFDLPAGAGAHGLTVTDLDGDGRPDLATANAVGASMSLFRNVGSGPVASNSFAPPVTISGPDNVHFVRAADLDADGRSELLLTSYLGQTLTVYRNQADPGGLNSNSFAAGVTLALAGRGHTISLGDLNGDARPDVAVDTEIGDSIALFQNQSVPGGFTNNSLAARVDLVAGWNAWGSSVGDLDGDGRPDIIFANTYDDNISIYRNVMPTNPPVSCAPTPPGLAATWRAEGNAVDSVSGTAGVLENVTFTAGEVGQGFYFNGSSQIKISASSSLDVGTSSGLTLETWLRPGHFTLYEPQFVFEWNNLAGGFGAQLLLSTDHGVYGDGFGNVMVNLVDTLGNSHAMFTASDVIVTNALQHVAFTYDKTSGFAVIYVNGLALASSNLGSFTPQTSYDLYLGNRPAGPFAGSYFNGVLDEPSLYNRALSVSEVQAIFTAGGAGKCPPAALAPSISQQPQDIAVPAGGNAQFDVTATGIPAPAYQWFFGDDALAGQTNATLSLSNVQPAQAGTYAVRVFNPSGFVLSSNTVLSVMTTQTVLLVDGNTSGFYNDSLGTILDGTAPQFPLPLGLGGDPEFYPADEPNLAAAAAVLGNWLTAPADLNTNWRSVAVIPDTWELNTETTIIYALDGGDHGVINLRGDFDADNGIYVWVNGQYKFGARAPGLPSPIGQFEYPNVSLGSLTPGSNYIQVLREDSGVSVGYQIRVTGTALFTNGQPPSITESPANQTVAAGSSAAFNVAAAGTPELYYQWRFNAGDLAGQTNTSLQLLDVQLSQAGEYSVLVSNTYGSVTSSVATLTVQTFPPTLTSQLQDQTVYAGKTVNLSVSATGTAPLRYHWSHNGTELSSVVTATLTLVNAQSNHAGIYQVVVSNDYGSVTSRLAQLTIVPPPPCAPAPDGVIAWWPGQSNVWDVVGGFDAQFTQSVPPAYLLYTTGKVGAALSFNYQPTIVAVTAGGLNLNTNTGLTIEGWIRPTTSGPLPIAEWNDGKTVGAGLLVSISGPGVIEATLTDSNVPVRTVTFRAPNFTITNSLWQHVALTYDKSAGVATILVNGNAVVQTNIGTMTPNTSGNVYLGYRPVGLYANSRFRGALDEITLYNRALSVAELQAIIAADETGKCPPPPPPCIKPPADIAAWWRGESNTVDSVAGNDAIRIPTNYPVALAYQAGQMGTAFSFKNQNFLSVPRSEGLDVATGSGLTIEAWIYPNTLSPMPIVEWTDTNSYGANLWLSFSRGPSVLEANLIDNAGGFHLIRSPINTIRSATWQHVAVTYDKTTGLAALYSDGNLITTTNLGFFTPRTHTELQIGFHPRSTGFTGDGAPPTIDYRFNGAIDELAIYRRALSAAEIRSVARLRPGKCLELPPTFSRQPQEQVALEGGTARFEVGVGGTAPFQYQWLLAGEPIVAATNSFLALAGVAPADTGFYSVLVSNAFGSVTSRVAALTVLPANQCLPTPFGAVAFWRGESNTLDELGSHPAQWGTNTLPAYTSIQTQTGGKVATAFRFTGQNHLLVPTNSNLDVGAGGGFTIEGWIKPDGLSGTQPVWDWNDGLGNIGVGLLLGRTGPGMLEVTVTDTNVTSTQLRVVTLTTPNFTLGSITNQVPAWSHVALTFDKATGKLNFFVNGKLVGERTIGLVPGGVSSGIANKLFSPVTTGNLHFGWRRSGVFQGSRFRGAMDEMSVYYRALSPLELQAIYIVGANGKCTPAPTCQPLASGIVSWWRGESNVLDSVDGNHGSGTPLPIYTNGIVGNAFRISSSYVQIPAVVLRDPRPSLNVGLGSGFTFETWFRRDAQSTYTIAAWNSGSLTQGVSFGSSPARGPDYFEASLVDTLGFSHVLSFYTYVPAIQGGLIPVGKWNHLAVTYEKLSGIAILFLNGSPVVATNLGSFTPRTTGDLYLGYRPPGNYPGSGNTLFGALDETTLYNRALSSGEITANYRNVANRCLMPPLVISHPESMRVTLGSDVTLHVVAAGNPLLHYQWFRDNKPVASATNATLIFTNFNQAMLGNYFVRVTNSFGTVFSSNAVLEINQLPVAQGDAFTTPGNTPAVFAAAKLTLNDTDADGDTLTAIAVSASSAQTGTVSLVSGTVTYTPPPSYIGNDVFTYTVTDNLGGNAVGNVMVTVGSGGAAPLNIVSGPAIEGGNFSVSFAGIPGLTYTIEAAASLSGPWSKVGDSLCPASNQGLGIGVFEFIEPIGTNSTRFYRTIYPSY